MKERGIKILVIGEPKHTIGRTVEYLATTRNHQVSVTSVKQEKDNVLDLEKIIIKNPIKRDILLTQVILKESKESSQTWKPKHKKRR